MKKQSALHPFFRPIRAGLAATLLAAVAQSATPAAGPPETIYYNGKVVTVDAAGTRQAFAVRGERFIAVGSDAQVRALAGPRTRLVDLDGATVIPGLGDNHDHLWNSARYLYRGGVDMVGVNSLPEFQSRLRTAVARAKPGEVVFTTTGWAIQPAPTRRDLDQVSASVPIVAVSSRRGIGVFNSAALTKLGISRENPTFRGVKVAVDAQGEPTGAAVGYPTGVYMFESLLPPLTAKMQDQIVRAAMQQRNALGITSIRDLAVWPDAVAGFQRMRREGKLTLRIGLGLEFPDQANTPAHLKEQPAPKYDDPWLYVDSVGEEPWSPATMPLEEFTALVREENRLGWRHAPHVNSDTLRGGTADQATDATLSAYEAADRDSPLAGKRWYMEHSPFATPAQMDRMAKLGLILSVQDAAYVPYVQLAYAPLPPERLAHQNPVRSLIDHGIVVIAGSDTSGPNPIEREPNNPLLLFRFYVTRRNRNGEVLTPSEAVSREEALKLFTANTAYAAFQEKVRGRIAPGMLADFVILNQDLMTVPEEKILDTHPLATFVGGRRVYAAPGAKF